MAADCTNVQIAYLLHKMGFFFFFFFMTWNLTKGNIMHAYKECFGN